MSEDEMSYDFQRASGMLNLKYYQGAIDLFQKDLDENPDNFPSLNNMAVAKIHIGIGKKNLELLAEAIENLQVALKIMRENFKYETRFTYTEGNLKWAQEELENLKGS